MVTRNGFKRGEPVVSELHELRMTPRKVKDEELRVLLEDYRRMAR